MKGKTNRLIYFISGMWCSTCSKSIFESVSKIDGVSHANINYATKLLIVEFLNDELKEIIDSKVQERVKRAGFGIKKQEEGWLQNFSSELKKDSLTRITYTKAFIVLFLSMWSSMIAFMSYIGGDLSDKERYYIALSSTILGFPAVVIGMIPYARSGVRALIYSKLITLDFFIFIGAISAIGASFLSLYEGGHHTYLDSSGMILGILLLSKRIENSIVEKSTESLLYELSSEKKKIHIKRGENWRFGDIYQTKKGDIVKYFPGEIISFDGIIESDEASINNHLMTGENSSTNLRKGERILSGAIALSEFDLKIEKALGEREIDEWAEASLISKNKKTRYEKIFAKIESLLVYVAFSGAILISYFSYLRGESLSLNIESFFVGILIFCPCLFATIIPLAKQFSRQTLIKKHIVLNNDDALWDLSGISHFAFDKTGTLELVESTFIVFEDSTVLPYLKTVAQNSTHVLFKNLEIKSDLTPLDKIIEEEGEGTIAYFEDKRTLYVGRKRFIEKQCGLTLTHFLETDTLVFFGGKVAGIILRQSLYKEESFKFLKSLRSKFKEADIYILSGDPSLEASKPYEELNVGIKYFGNLTPREKEDMIPSNTLYIGDGLNDILALSKAKVSLRIGNRIDQFALVDVILKNSSLFTVLSLVNYSKKYKRVLVETALCAFIYNIVTIGFAMSGGFKPIAAVLAMSMSFTLLFLSISRLKRMEL